MNKCERYGCETRFVDTSKDGGKTVEPGTAAWSVDFWVFGSMFDEEGEATKTGEDVQTKQDYLSVCPECWEFNGVKELWEEFVKKVKGEMR